MLLRNSPQLSIMQDSLVEAFHLKIREMEWMWEARDKTVLITGGATGLGAGKVEALLKDGAKAIAILDIAENAVKELIARCKPESERITFIKCDVSNEENLTKAFGQVLSTFKHLDLIINCAGIMDDSPGQWSKSCDINLKALISLTWKGIDHMSKDKGGRGGTIVNVSSKAALIRTPVVPVYCATKSAVLQFSRCLTFGDFFERTNVRILTICYSATNTAIFGGLKHKEYDENRGNFLENLIDPASFQKVESAVHGFMEMLQKGSCGSVWYSGDDKPIKDITSAIDEAFDVLGRAIELVS